MTKRKLTIEVDCEDETCGECEKGRATDGWCLEFERYRERSDGTRSNGYPAVLGPYPRSRLQSCIAAEQPVRTCGTCRHYRSDGVCKLDGCDRGHDEGCQKWEACGFNSKGFPNWDARRGAMTEGDMMTREMRDLLFGGKVEQ